MGMSGAMLRGSGIEWDLRKKQPYEVYEQLDFDIPVGVNGDCYDRYLVHCRKCVKSTRIVKQCIGGCAKNPGPVMIDNHKDCAAVAAWALKWYGRAIHHFKLFWKLHVPEGEVVRRRRGIRRRIRHLPDVRRREQAASPQDSRAGLRASVRAPTNGARHMIADARDDHRHAGHRVRRSRSLQDVFIGARLHVGSKACVKQRGTPGLSQHEVGGGFFVR